MIKKRESRQMSPAETSRGQNNPLPIFHELPAPRAKLPWLEIFIAAACAAGFMATLRSPPGTKPLVNYLLLALFVSITVSTLMGRYLPLSKKLAAFAGTTAAIIAWVLYANWLDTYDQRWSQARGPSEVSYVDSYHRGAELPYFRRIASDDDGERFRASGGMAGEGKPHGRWVEYSFGKGLSFEHRVVFYWYGEEIAEGKWHLRDNGRR